MKTRTHKQKLADCHTVYKAAKTGTRPEQQAKDRSVPTHPVVSVPNRSEAKVLTECIKWLKQHRVFHDRHDCGSGHGHAIYGIKHSGDIHGILPCSLGQTAGKHFEIEFKRGGGGRLSEGQQERMWDVRAAGGQYWVVHGVAELVHYMKGLV